MLLFLQKYYPDPGIVSGLFIFILCLLPGAAFPDVGWAAALAPDKWVHFILYALWMLIHVSGMKNRTRQKVAGTAGFMFVYGGVIELFQEYALNDRSGEWLDWAADGVGLVVGWLILTVILKMDKKSL